MKKQLLTATALFFAVSLSAQKQPKLLTFQDLLSAPTAKAPKPENTNKTLGVTLWSDNFSTPTNWVLDNSGQTGIDFGWNINSASDGWWAANGIASTGGGNYAELVNGDPTASPATQALGVTYTMTTAAPIDIVALGGSNQVSIQFQQYGARFNDLQEVQISTNGTTWTTVSNNLNESVLSSAGGAAYANPTNKTINLAPILSTNPAPIWIRFSWTTNYPSSATNPNVWITYGWYIDNVKIATNSTNDLSVTSDYVGSAGLFYTQIPITQTAPIDFEVDLFNGGVNTQTNVQYNVNINGGAFTGSSPSTAIVSLDTMTLTVGTAFTPASLAAYTVVHSITADSTDDIPTNNVVGNTAFSVTNYIYARDNGTAAGSTSNGTDGFEVGNLFDIVAPQTLKAVDVRLLGGANGTVVGTEVFVKIYSIDANGDFAFESESDPVIVVAGDLNTNKTFVLSMPVNMVAGTYLAVCGAYSQGLKVVNAGTTDPQTSFFLDLFDNTWYYQTAIPYVRLNFSPTIGLDENSANLNSMIYPNPADGILNIKLQSETQTAVSVSILDNTGKEVLSSNTDFNGTETMSLNIENLSAGIYSVRLASETSVVTTKFVKK
jgi:hypothetical protein